MFLKPTGGGILQRRLDDIGAVERSSMHVSMRSDAPFGLFGAHDLASNAVLRPTGGATAFKCML